MKKEFKKKHISTLFTWKFIVSASICKINRWHGNKIKLNKNDKYTSVNKNGEQMLVSFSVDKNTLSYQIPPQKCQNTANDKSSIV